MAKTTDPRTLPTEALTASVAEFIVQYKIKPRHLRDEGIVADLEKIEKEIQLWRASKGLGPAVAGGGKAPMDDREARRLCLEFLLGREVSDNELEILPSNTPPRKDKR